MKGYSEAGASWRKRSLKGFDAPSGSPREDIDYNNATLRQRARILRMSTPVASSAIKTNRTNVVGVGLRPKSRIARDALGLSVQAADDWQKRTDREFALWAEDKRACDATGVNDFYAMQQLALCAWLESGDVFALYTHRDPTVMRPYGLRLHLIEADRIGTPITAGGFFTTDGRTKSGNAIYDGVEVDAGGMVIAYYIRSTYPYQVTAGETEWVRVEACGPETGLPNIVQVMDSERPDQYRGVSYLAPVIEQVLQLRRYIDSELTAAVIQGFMTAFVTTETPDGMLPFDETGPEMKDRDPNDYLMGPGEVRFLRQGEGITFTKPEHPTTTFAEFSRAICEEIGAALEIPVDMLLKSFNASYSASRAALMEAWKAFRMRREWFVKDFCRPTYEVWMSEAVARGRISAPGFFTDPIIRAAYLEAEWIGPSQGQLDPVKEITAEILACKEGFSTHEQSTIRLSGGQWEANVEQLQRENELLTQAGMSGPDPHQVKKSVESSLKEDDGNGNGNSNRNSDRA